VSAKGIESVAGVSRHVAGDERMMLRRELDG